MGHQDAFSWFIHHSHTRDNLLHMLYFSSIDLLSFIFKEWLVLTQAKVNGPVHARYRPVTCPFDTAISRARSNGPVTCPFDTAIFKRARYMPVEQC